MPETPPRTDADAVPPPAHGRDDAVDAAAPLTVAVVGPTASGKSDLAVQLCNALDADAVNADAMQLYRGMDIGTAKLSLDERQGVVHHLLDVLDVTQEASVAAYQRDATAIVDDLARQGRTAVVVGGSGLYVRAALDDLDIPPTDPDVRAVWEAELARVGPHRLHEELQRRDPAAAAAILPGNGRRIVRALEVGELTGAPFIAALPEPRYRRPTVQIGLTVDREELDARIDARVERMWEAGLPEEVDRLLDQGLARGKTASRALGYQQAIDASAGRITMAEAKDLTAQGTRRYARRQLSWFRRDTRIVWLPSGSADLLDRSLEAVAAARKLQAGAPPILQG